MSQVPVVDSRKLAAVCVRYGIASLEVFGSAARGESGPGSDVDVLYELKPGARLGWEIEDFNRELEELFDRPVDLVSKKALHPLLRASVLTESRPLYAA